jgi:hypothetical protein
MTGYRSGLLCRRPKEHYVKATAGPAYPSRVIDDRVTGSHPQDMVLALARPNSVLGSAAKRIKEELGFGS